VVCPFNKTPLFNIHPSFIKGQVCFGTQYGNLSSYTIIFWHTTVFVKQAAGRSIYRVPTAPVPRSLMEGDYQLRSIAYRTYWSASMYRALIVVRHCLLQANKLMDSVRDLRRDFNRNMFTGFSFGQPIPQCSCCMQWRDE